MRGTLDRRFFRQPDFLEIRVFALDHLDLTIQLRQLLYRGGGLVFFDCLAFNLELNQASLQSIHRLGFGVDFHTDTARRLIDQVNRFIGQLPVGDIALAQLRRRNNGAISNIHAVVHLIALL